VYILRTISGKDRFYVGFTEDLNARIVHHNSGGVMDRQALACERLRRMLLRESRYVAQTSLQARKARSLPQANKHAHWSNDSEAPRAKAWGIFAELRRSHNNEPAVAEAMAGRLAILSCRSARAKGRITPAASRGALWRRRVDPLDQ